MQINKYSSQSFGMNFSPSANSTIKDNTFSPVLRNYFSELGQKDDEYYLDSLNLNKAKKSAEFTITNLETGITIVKNISEKRICSFVKSLLDNSSLNNLFKKCQL